MFSLLVITMMLGAMLAHPKAAWACSCVMPPAPADAFTQWEAVFEGQAASVTEAYSLPFVNQIREWLGLPYTYNYGNRLVTFEVARSWKGVTTTRVEVRTGSGGGDCGYEFVTGVSYVIYAGQTSESDWGTSICTRTTPSASAVDDLTYLGPLPTLPLIPSPIPFNWLWACAGIFAVVIVLALITLWLWRTRRARHPHPQSPNL